MGGGRAEFVFFLSCVCVWFLSTRPEMRHFVFFFTSSSSLRQHFSAAAHRLSFLDSHSAQLLSVKLRSNRRASWDTERRGKKERPGRFSAITVSHHRTTGTTSAITVLPLRASAATDLVTDAPHVTETLPTDLPKHVTAATLLLGLAVK